MDATQVDVKASLSQTCPFLPVIYTPTHFSASDALPCAVKLPVTVSAQAYSDGTLKLTFFIPPGSRIDITTTPIFLYAFAVQGDVTVATNCS